MKAKILVTGGCGYIGSHTIADLLDKGFDVVSVDNFSRGKKYIPEHIYQITGKRITNINAYLTNISEVRDIFKEEKNISGIIHFAAYKMVGESVANPLIYYHNNLISLINLLECRQEFNCPYFIFSSSSSVYGNIDTLPVREDTSVFKQESPYGRTKYFGEVIISDTIKAHPFDCFILRYFNPVGAHPSALLGEPLEEKPSNAIPAITRTAIGKQKEFVINGIDYATRDGSCIRDYIHIMDIAEAHTLALEYLIQQNKLAQSSIFETINLGTGKGVSVLEIIAAFESATGIKLNHRTGPRRPGDAIAIYSDNKKAAQILHWSSKRSLEEMMRSAWEWEKAMSSNE